MPAGVAAYTTTSYDLTVALGAAPTWHPNSPHNATHHANSTELFIAPHLHSAVCAALGERRLDTYLRMLLLHVPTQLTKA